MNWTVYGPHGLLIRFADGLGEGIFERGRAIALELERNPPPGLLEFIPAFTSVLLEFDPRSPWQPELLGPRLVRQLTEAAAQPVPTPPPKQIPVVYDGPDLQRVADHAQMDLSEVVERHQAVIYHVYMLGFSPGFPYLGDLDPRLHTPRLPSPRPRIRAGSVGIGGAHTGIYSVETPGGWNLIGRTSLKLFDPARSMDGGEPAEMFFLKAGDRVQFVQVD